MSRRSRESSTWVLRLDPVDRFLVSLRPLLAAGIVAAALLVTAPDPFELVVASILLAAGALLAVLDAFRVRLVVDATDVRVLNRFAAHRFPLADVGSVSAGYDGLEIELVDGTSVTAAAVRLWNTSTLRRHPSQADEVAAELLRRAARIDSAPARQG